MAKYIIIGNSVAANAAAENIRKNDASGSIQIFSKEKIPHYYVRPFQSICLENGMSMQ